MRTQLQLLFKFLNAICLTRHRSVYLESLENVYTYYLRLLLILGSYIVLNTFQLLDKPSLVSVGAIAGVVEVVNLYDKIPVTLSCMLFLNLNHQRIFGYFRYAVKELQQSCSKQLTRLFYLQLFKVALVQIPFTLRYDLKAHLLLNFSCTLLFSTNLSWCTALLLLRCIFKQLNISLKTLSYHHYWLIEDYGLQRTSSLAPLFQKSAATYNQLCTYAKTISEVYGWIIILSVAMLFVEMLFDAFSICHVIQRIISFDVQYVCFGVVSLITFLELILPCIMLQEESDKFTNTLNRLDLTLQKEADLVMVNNLILQTYHQKIHMHAKEFFPLDGTLVYSMFGAITTYLVILLQFDE